jgi:hypothetical protein
MARRLIYLCGYVLVSPGGQKHGVGHVFDGRHAPVAHRAPLQPAWRLLKLHVVISHLAASRNGLYA